MWTPPHVDPPPTVWTPALNPPSRDCYRWTRHHAVFEAIEEALLQPQLIGGATR